MIGYDMIGMLTWVVAVHYLRGLLDEPNDVCGDVRDTYSLYIQYSHHPPHRWDIACPIAAVNIAHRAAHTAASTVTMVPTALTARIIVTSLGYKGIDTIR